MGQNMLGLSKDIQFFLSKVFKFWMVTIFSLNNHNFLMEMFTNTEKLAVLYWKSRIFDQL